ncbi:MAG: DNA-3-methyladenine glycosylase family protein [Candidatus Thorarchaeota archaeon]
MPNVFTARVLARFAKKAPELKDAISSRELVLEPSKEPPFQMLVRSIVYQQLSGKAARTIHDRMIELVGDLTSESVLAVSQEELRSVGLSRQKASYLHNVAAAFGKGGPLRSYTSLDALKKLSSAEIVQLFTAIKGVGEWTVQMYLIFSLGRLDVLSPGDLGVRKGMMKLYGLEDMPTPSQVKKFAEKWHPLETVGTCLAWRVLRDD